MNYENVSRLEIIDSKGRSYVEYGIVGMTFDLQDDGRTLKIFVTADEEKANQTRKQLFDDLTQLSQQMGLYNI
jgi:hypothetical protein